MTNKEIVLKVVEIYKNKKENFELSYQENIKTTQQQIMFDLCIAKPNYKDLLKVLEKHKDNFTKSQKKKIMQDYNRDECVCYIKHKILTWLGFFKSI